MWIGLFINFTISMMYGLLLYMDATKPIVYIVLPLIWISSFSFLLDGLRRIRKVMSSLSDRVEIFSAFLFQSTTCALFILGQVPNLIFAFVKDTKTDKNLYNGTRSYSIISIFNNATCFLCQICLIIIFN